MRQRCFDISDTRCGRWTHGSVKPQFPTYLFAGIDDGTSTQQITQTIGVRDLVRNGVEAVILALKQIIEIRKRCNETFRNSIPIRSKVDGWKVGGVVPVSYGPLVGIPVQIINIDRSGRVSASIGNLDVSFRAGRSNPAQHPPGITVLVGCAHDPERRSRMRPEVVPLRHGCRGDMLAHYLRGLVASVPRPFEVGERACEPEHMRRPFGQPFALASVEAIDLTVDKLSKPLDMLPCISGKRQLTWRSWLPRLASAAILRARKFLLIGGKHPH
jgi:hypothetical protein